MPSLNKQLQNVEGKKGTLDLWISSFQLYQLSYSNHGYIQNLLNI
jgi:hypothetical protein